MKTYSQKLCTAVFCCTLTSADKTTTIRNQEYTYRNIFQLMCYVPASFPYCGQLKTLIKHVISYALIG